MYYCSDLYMSEFPRLARPQLLACNSVKITSKQQLEDLINLPLSLFVYNDWVVPADLKDLVVRIVAKAPNFLANEVLEIGQTSNKPLADVEKDLLKIGLPSEYLLD